MEKVSKRFIAERILTKTGIIAIIAIATLFVGLSASDAFASAEPVSINSAILSEDGSSVDIVWKKTEGVKRYDIYRAKYGSKSFDKIGSVKASGRGYTDKEIEEYTTYQYKVKAVAKSGKSSYSGVVYAYTGDVSEYTNENLKFYTEFANSNDGKPRDLGNGVTTYCKNITVTLKYKGEKLSDFNLYYDKSSLKITKTAGKFKIKTLKAGKHLITIKSGTVKGTYFVNAGKNSGGVDYRIKWNGTKYYSDICFYPTQKNEILTVLRNEKATSNFTVKSSDTSIAKVKKSGSKIYITNKRVGKCNIIISGGSYKGEITWVVRRGNALTLTSIEGVPYSPNISESKARKALNEITKAEFSYKEIKMMAKNEPELSFWEEKLSHPADVMQMIWALDFDKTTEGKIDNQNIWYDGYDWCSKLSPEENYAQRYLICLSVSEFMNQVLRGDMEEQGYVQYSSPGGGHAFCYYKVNGLYVFCDFLSSITDKNCDFTEYVVYISDSKEDFANYYINSKKCYTTLKNSEYIYMLYTIKTEGRTVPLAKIDSVYAINAAPSGIIPKTWKGENINEIMDILYLAPGFEPKYVDEPPLSTWTFL